MKKRNGFTLIELLVVVAIIAVLISMLLPALASAREAARGAACASNLHQIGTAFVMYHNEYNTFPNEYNGAPIWSTQLKQYIDLTLKHNNCMLCPSNKNPFTNTSYVNDPDASLSTYGFNTWLGLGKNFVPASELVILTDAKSGHLWRYAHITWSDAFNCQLNYLHKDGLNLLFCDGHVNYTTRKVPLAKYWNWFAPIEYNKIDLIGLNIWYN
jgi:prepilin-type N-terminal cleavage/methylation domain-containing protein/prepilin-type processing-associated H-X9-DG protein